MFDININDKKVTDLSSTKIGASFTHRGLMISAIRGKLPQLETRFYEVVIFAPDGFNFPDGVTDQFGDIGTAVLQADKIADAIDLGLMVLVESQ